MNEEITNINQLYDGIMVTCKLSGRIIKEARIRLNGKTRVYICQNSLSGNDTLDKFGFEYSWVVIVYADGTLRLNDSSVLNLKKHKSSDKLILKKDDERKT